MRKDDANEESGTLLFSIWNVKDRIYRAECSGSIKERKVEKSEICESGKHGY